MITSYQEKNHNNNIGTIRFVAAFMVLYGHGYNLCGGSERLSQGFSGLLFDPVSRLIMPYSPFNLPLASLGVCIFFSMSGYLVTASYQRRERVLDFAIARVLRIYPALVMAILVCVFIIGLNVTSLQKIDYLSSKITWDYVFSNMILFDGVRYFLPGVFIELPFFGAINGSLWSLPFEVYLYIAVGLLGIGRVLNNKKIANIFFFIVLGCCFFMSMEKQYPFSTNYVEAAIISFVFGSFFCINKLLLKGYRLFLIYGSIYLFIYLLEAEKLLICQYFFTLVLTTVVLKIGISKQCFFRLDKYGDFSYGLYLYAMPMQQLMIMLFGSDSPELINYSAFVLAMCCSIASWFIIEKKMISFKRPVSDWLYRYLRQGD